MSRWHQYAANQRFLADETGNHLCATPSPDAAARLVAEHNALVDAAEALAETLEAFEHCNTVYVPQLKLSAIVRERAEAALANLENLK